MNKLKYLIKKIVPSFIWIFLRAIDRKRQLIILCYYDANRYIRYSASYSEDTSIKLLGNIIKTYHIIEKGITMPNRHLGFGYDKVLLLCDYCKRYQAQYSANEIQLTHAVAVLNEYKKIHDDASFILRADVSNQILSLTSNSNISPSSQINMAKEDFFKYVKSDFAVFSNSRSSVRTYINEDLPLEKILSAIDLAKNTPSACNRQAWRTYIYTNRNEIDAILDIQGGSRGFGHLGNKLLVITAELGVFTGGLERNQAFIDGGMYLMNVLYALHYNEIACCTLNCSNSKNKDLKLRNICLIKESEVFIAMVICGIPPDNFMIATSKRYNFIDTNIIVG